MSPTPDEPTPIPQPRRVLCPYCGEESRRPTGCDRCGGRFDPLSRQATVNSMGPWFVRDPARPFRPGCSYEVIQQMARSGRIRPDTVLRGPTTGQFWSLAKRTPGVAGLLGICYACQAELPEDAASCHACGARVGHAPDRQHLGLSPVHVLPGEGASGGTVAGAGGGAARAEEVPHGGRAPEASPTRTRGTDEPAATRDVGSWIGVGVLILVGIAAVAAVVLMSIDDWPGGQETSPRVATEPPAAPMPGQTGAQAGSRAASTEPEPERARRETGADAEVDAGAPADAPGSAASEKSAGAGPHAKRTRRRVPERAAALLVRGTREALTEAPERGSRRAASGGQAEAWIAEQRRKRLRYLDLRSWTDWQ